MDNSTDFNRTWDEYAAGFGDLDGNYWLGLEQLHLLTGTGTRFRLKVELGSWLGENASAEYDQFELGPSRENYRVFIGPGFKGTDTWDMLSYSNGRYFTTRDNDNDGWSGGNCAAGKAGGGGWWYGGSACAKTYPTGVYGDRGDSGVPYMWWTDAFDTHRNALKSLTIKAQPV